MHESYMLLMLLSKRRLAKLLAKLAAAPGG